MTPKQAAIRDFISGEFYPSTPSDYTYEQRSEYYKAFQSMIHREAAREDEELRAGI